jgi:serine/threonine protein kinase
MAPEIIEKKPYRGEAADLFSSAIICFILTTGLPPFRRAEVSNPHYQHIFLENWTRYWMILRRSNVEVSAEFKDFIEKMLCYKPESRMSMAEVWEHPWITGPTATYEEAVAFMRGFE